MEKFSKFNDGHSGATSQAEATRNLQDDYLRLAADKTKQPPPNKPQGPPPSTPHEVFKDPSGNTVYIFDENHTPTVEELEQIFGVKKKP